MISARKLRANRANARASTGPRTVAGKARATRNARRHGLTLSVLADPAGSAEVEALAREIAGEGANLELQELACRIAAAQIDLVRVRRARYQLLSRALGDPVYESPGTVKKKTLLVSRLARTLGPDALITPGFVGLVVDAVDSVLVAKPEGPDKFATILSNIAPQLAVMDRYERRALSRRKFATRGFDAARAGAV